MNLAILGNCQTLVYTKYISLLAPEFNVRWIRPLCFKDHVWYRKSRWDCISEKFLLEPEEQNQFLKKSDYILCQPISRSYCDEHNLVRMKDLYSEKIITISACPKPPLDLAIRNMQRVEESLDVDIKLSKIFVKNPDKAFYVDEFAHPNVFFLLEAIKMLCIHFKINFFNEGEYKKLLTSEIF